MLKLVTLLRDLPGPAAHSGARRDQVRFWALAGLLALGMQWWFLQGFSWDYPRFSLAGMLDGSAHRPFITRALVPLLLRLSVTALPVDPQAVAVALMYGSLLGSVWALRLLAQSFWPPSTRLDAAVLLSVPALAPLTIAYTMIYDFPTLFLFTLGLALMARERWAAFLAVFALGSLNRETTALLALVLLVAYAGRLPARRLAGLMAAQGLIYVLVRGAVAWQFRHNPGSSVEFNLWLQAVIFIFMPLASAAHLLLAAAVGLLVAANYRAKPRFLRAALVALAPTLLALYALFGNPWEIRVFYELFPICYLLAFQPHWLQPPGEAAGPGA